MHLRKLLCQPPPPPHSTAITMKLVGLSSSSPFLQEIDLAVYHTHKITTLAKRCTQVLLISWLVLTGILHYVAGPRVETNPNYKRLGVNASAAASYAACFYLCAILLHLIHWIHSSVSALNKFGHNQDWIRAAVVALLCISALTEVLLVNCLTPVIYLQDDKTPVFLMRSLQMTTVVRISLFFFIFVQPVLIFILLSSMHRSNFVMALNVAGLCIVVFN